MSIYNIDQSETCKTYKDYQKQTTCQLFICAADVNISFGPQQ